MNIFGYYINLLERTDRKNHFENKIKKYSLFKNIMRFDAIKNINGAVGCTLSHIAALELLKARNDPADTLYAILEDDLMIFPSKYTEFDNFCRDFNHIIDLDSWDVIILTPNMSKTIIGSPEMESLGFKRLINTQSTTGYIFRPKMIDILINNFKQSLVMKKPLDIYWKPMQSDYNFYYYETIFACQLPGFSNIEKRQVDYTDYFMKVK